MCYLVICYSTGHRSDRVVGDLLAPPAGGPLQRMVRSSPLLQPPDVRCTWSAILHQLLISDWCAELQANSYPLSSWAQARADVSAKFPPQPRAALQ